jgi:hypothetical protein
MILQNHRQRLIIMGLMEIQLLRVRDQPKTMHDLQMSEGLGQTKTREDLLLRPQDAAENQVEDEQRAQPQGVAAPL